MSKRADTMTQGQWHGTDEAEGTQTQQVAELVANLPPLDPCRRCAGRKRTWTWQTTDAGQIMLREDCAECGRYVRWAPQRWPFVGLADLEETA